MNEEDQSLAIRSFDDTEDVRRQEKKKHIVWNLPQDKSGTGEKSQKADSSVQSKKSGVSEQKAQSPKPPSMNAVP